MKFLYQISPIILWDIWQGKNRGKFDNRKINVTCIIYNNFHLSVESPMLDSLIMSFLFKLLVSWITHPTDKYNPIVMGVLGVILVMLEVVVD